jgi:hypothetical protein
MEHSFDAWTTRSQERLWTDAFAQLQGFGVSLSSQTGQGNPLQTSPVLFRVHEARGAYQVEPVHVFAGDYYLIADPDASVVRFEAITADQNLRL